MLFLGEGRDEWWVGKRQEGLTFVNIKRKKEGFRICPGISIPLHKTAINYSDMANLNRIKIVLVEKGKTGKWLAGEIGKTPCTVSKWCSNSVQPDLQTLDKISKLLDVNIKDLLVNNKE